MQLSLFRTCSQCGKTKFITEFYRNGNNLHGQCKTCLKTKALHRYAENPAPTKERSAQWRKEHPEEHHNSLKKWYRDNKDKHLEYHKEWMKQHPEKESEYKRDYHKRKPEIARAYVRRRRARLNNAEGDFTESEFQALVLNCGRRCLACGQETTLYPDHVVPISKGGRNSIDNIQPLCKPCNSRKGTRTIDYRLLK